MKRCMKHFALSVLMILCAGCIPQDSVRAPSWAMEGDQIREEEARARKELARSTRKIRIDFRQYADDAVLMTIHSDHGRLFSNPIIEVVEQYPSNDQKIVLGFDWNGQSRIIHPPRRDGRTAVSAIMQLVDENRNASGYLRVFRIESSDIELSEDRVVAFVIPATPFYAKHSRSSRLHGRVIIREDELK